jgi:hypothetical protein
MDRHIEPNNTKQDISLIGAVTLERLRTVRLELD